MKGVAARTYAAALAAAWTRQAELLAATLAADRPRPRETNPALKPIVADWPRPSCYVKEMTFGFEALVRLEPDPVGAAHLLDRARFVLSKPRFLPTFLWNWYANFDGWTRAQVRFVFRADRSEGLAEVGGESAAFELT